MMGNGGGDRWQSARETPGHVGPELQVNSPFVLLRPEPECSARCPLDALPIARCSKTRSSVPRSSRTPWTLAKTGQGAPRMLRTPRTRDKESQEAPWMPMAPRTE